MSVWQPRTAVCDPKTSAHGCARGLPNMIMLLIQNDRHSSPGVEFRLAVHPSVLFTGNWPVDEVKIGFQTQLSHDFNGVWIQS